MKEIKNKIYELTTLLNKYRKEYYELDAPTISDYEYDSLLHNLEQLADKMGVARLLDFNHCVAFYIFSILPTFASGAISISPLYCRIYILTDRSAIIFGRSSSERINSATCITASGSFSTFSAFTNEPPAPL